MKKSYMKYVSTVLVLALALVLIAAAVPDAAFADAVFYTHLDGYKRQTA